MPERCDTQQCHASFFGLQALFVYLAEQLHQYLSAVVIRAEDHCPQGYLERYRSASTTEVRTTAVRTGVRK
ncbi:MAG: hypothetical protein P8X74_23145 [Reinekea sp.]